MNRPEYKLAVDTALRAQPKPVVLPQRKHPMWEVVERCWEANKSISECVALVNRLYAILKEGSH
jgi:hypothetical protein